MLLLLLRCAEPTPSRGAVYGHYAWGQSLSECSVSVPVPPGTRAKQLDVRISRDKLSVGVEGAGPDRGGERAPVC